MNILYNESLEIPKLNDCIKLVDNYNCFICVDETVDNIAIKTFNYRSALPAEFNQKYARNLRGIGYNAETGKLLYLPMHKFFNYNENEFTLDYKVNKWDIKTITEKYDGSLIIFYLLNNKLLCRTQNNSVSNQSIWAMDLVTNNKNGNELIKSITEDINNGYTPMFEFVSWRNRIVVKYEYERIIYIGHRNRNTGEFSRDKDRYIQYGIESVKSYNIKEFTMDKIIEICTNSTEDREGFVVEFTNGEMVKIKLAQYFSLHKTKDELLNDKNVVKLALEGKIDDILPMLEFDSEFRNHIVELSNKTIIAYRGYIEKATKYYNENKDLITKDFAIKAKKETTREIFNLSMNLYNYGAIDKVKFMDHFIKFKLWESDENANGSY
jgi:T4 RnlA family RNA ligase